MIGEELPSAAHLSKALASWKADAAPTACVYLPFLLANKMWEDHPVFLGCSIKARARLGPQDRRLHWIQPLVLRMDFYHR
jgi:hypothetical protein